ncbi:uncharacterized protein A1O5_07713 [Cladophialophora psammophila CBS 110553]|uniref:Uncharacterized protein n=1 Tax=Cladophialophora psammophila CBS 110553 TaxID=1182543 RepID=W9WKV7_9EURO|nr:uncharacterized protein A1O5_07713 [Cladophialophora psammophila CBS 110553]EXJ68782.1 hypothetical protein A1O5_07713 [Cladophialophora psammophila CBS 110553]
MGHGEIATRGVAQKFNEGRYNCAGQHVRSTAGGSGFSQVFLSYNHLLAWTIILSDVPGHATSQDVEAAIKLEYDKPRQVKMGPISHEACGPEVSVEVRSRLERYGPIQSFYLAPESTGKRLKATAWLQHEAEARSACSLGGRTLDISNKPFVWLPIPSDKNHLQAAKVIRGQTASLHPRKIVPSASTRPIPVSALQLSTSTALNASRDSPNPPRRLAEADSISSAAGTKGLSQLYTISRD